MECLWTRDIMTGTTEAGGDRCETTEHDERMGVLCRAFASRDTVCLSGVYLEPVRSGDDERTLRSKWLPCLWPRSTCSTYLCAAVATCVCQPGGGDAARRRGPHLSHTLSTRSGEYDV